MVHKMKTLEEVLYDYTRGEKTLEEANKALRQEANEIFNTRDERLKSMTDESVPVFYSCRTRPTAGAFWTTVWAAWKRSMW